MALPEKLSQIVEMFAGAPKQYRLEALLDLSRRLAPLPPELASHPERMERVPECQTAFFVATQLQDGRVTFHFDAPPESPTTRGFAAVLAEGLNGSTVEEVLAVPDDFYVKMGLAELITSLRLRGMGAILARAKRQLIEAANRVASAPG